MVGLRILVAFSIIEGKGVMYLTYNLIEMGYLGPGHTQYEHSRSHTPRKKLDNSNSTHDVFGIMTR